VFIQLEILLVYLHTFFSSANTKLNEFSLYVPWNYLRGCHHHILRSEGAASVCLQVSSPSFRSPSLQGAHLVCHPLIPN
jgi:hypothetical protein